MNYGRGVHLHGVVLVREVEHLAGTNQFGRLNRVRAEGQAAGHCKIDHGVGHHARDAQVGEIRFGQRNRDRLGHRADAELQRGTVLD